MSGIDEGLAGNVCDTTTTGTTWMLSLIVMLDSMGSRPGRSLVVACEPADVTAGMGLSDQARKALPHAVRAVEKILEPVQRKKEADIDVHAD
jgi:Ni,Fe-hydrogenase maturation factor